MHYGWFTWKIITRVYIELAYLSHVFHEGTTEYRADYSELRRQRPSPWERPLIPGGIHRPRRDSVTLIYLSPA